MPSRNEKRARLMAELRYAPQSAALLELLTQRRGDYSGDLEASRMASRGIARSAKAAIGPTRRDFRGSRAATLQRTEAASENIAGLGEAAVPYQASFTGEAALADQLSRQRNRDVVTELRQRRVDAAASGASEQRQLRAQYGADVNDIGRQLQSVAAQQGAYQSSAFQDLLDAAANRGLQRDRIQIDARRADETARHNRASEGIDQQRADQARREAARRSGRRWLSQSQTNREFDQIDEARSWIPKLQQAGYGTGQIRQMLRTGEDIPAMVDPRTGTRLPGITIPKVPRDYVNAAFDLEVLRYLTRPNIDALHKRGILIRGRYPARRPRVAPLPPGVAGPDVNERG